MRFGSPGSKNDEDRFGIRFAIRAEPIQEQEIRFDEQLRAIRRKEDTVRLSCVCDPSDISMTEPMHETIDSGSGQAFGIRSVIRSQKE